MNCPLCSATAEEGATECPSCGVLFGKLRERREHEKKALAQAEVRASPPPFNPWKVRFVAAAVVAAWLLGFGLYYRARMARIPRQEKPRSGDIPFSVLLRDPATGNLEKVPVLRAPLSSRQEPPPAREPVRPSDAPAYDPDFDD